LTAREGRVIVTTMSQGSTGEASRSGADPLRVGMVLPAPPPGAKRPAVVAAAVRVKLGVFCHALSDILSSAVESRTFVSYTQLLEAVFAGDIDVAWLPPRVAARAVDDAGVVPLVVPLRGEHAWYASALFSSPGSAIQSIEDLRNLRVAWVDPESMAGYVVIRGWLRTRGVNLDEAFAEESFLGGHEQVVAAVLDGHADVGATYAHQEAGGERITSAGWADAPVHVIGVAGPIPSDVLSVGSKVAPEVRSALCEALTGDMDGDLRGAALALFEADRFVEAEDDAIRALGELLSGLDGKP